MLTLISYNVNGIRSALSKGLADWLRQANPDVLCLNETKAQPEQMGEDLFASQGYHSYFFSAEKKGYSGVAMFCKQRPDRVVYGMGMERYDCEGRVLRADFGALSIVSVYVPSGTTGDLRQTYKMEFLEDFARFMDKLRQERPCVVVCGDFNICHQPIDINHPERQIGVSGFLPEEREWFSRFLDSGWVDSFRVKNQQPEQYSWWSYRAGARARNVGWRIDYLLTTELLREKIQQVGILTEAVHSDHCPVLLGLNW